MRMNEPMKLEPYDASEAGIKRAIKRVQDNIAAYQSLLNCILPKELEEVGECVKVMALQAIAEDQAWIAELEGYLK